MRKDRSVSEVTRLKISKSLKDFYRNKWSQAAREQRSKKLSSRLREYWATIPQANNKDK